MVAESFARIFYRNSVDGGFFIPFEAVERLIGDIKTGDRLVIDVNKGELKNETSGKTWALKPLGEVSEIIKAGNIFEYARKAGLIPTN